MGTDPFSKTFSVSWELWLQIAIAEQQGLSEYWDWWRSWANKQSWYTEVEPAWAYGLPVSCSTVLTWQFSSVRLLWSQSIWIIVNSLVSREDAQPVALLHDNWESHLRYLLVKLFQGGCHIHPRLSSEGGSKPRFKAYPPNIQSRPREFLRPPGALLQGTALTFVSSLHFLARGWENAEEGMGSPVSTLLLLSFFSYKDALRDS